MQLLILVGQSRSGSTLLTRLLNGALSATIINDAYITQVVDQLGRQEELDEAAAANLAAEWLQIIRDRSEPEPPPTIHKSLVLHPRDFETLSTHVIGKLRTWSRWPEIVEGTLSQLARLNRAAAYGWNTPPDYARAEELLRQFPNSRMIFLIRDPMAVLLSYKHLPDYWGDERNRYNPFLQAIVWRHVVQKYETLVKTMPDRVMLTRYEDLTGNTVHEVKRMADFAGLPCALPDLQSLGRNSSRDGKPGLALSRVEARICRWITGGLRERHGYAKSAVPVSRDLELGGFLAVLFRSASYYGARITFSRDMRTRISRFAKLLISRG
jgi:hypothetical protein